MCALFLFLGKKNTRITSMKATLDRIVQCSLISVLKDQSLGYLTKCTRKILVVELVRSRLVSVAVQEVGGPASVN